MKALGGDWQWEAALTMLQAGGDTEVESECWWQWDGSGCSGHKIESTRAGDSV